jgi:GT2 family glycosyltransferase
MIRVSVSVINWNNRDHILACLDSLFCQQGITLDVVMLDNGSSDGSCELVRQRFPELRVIENGRNLGFAAAHNIGYRATMGEWHLVLNSDVMLAPDYVIHLLNAGASHPSVGATSGKLLRFETADGHNIIDSVGIEIFESRRVWDRGTGELDRGEHEQSRQVFGCCGAAALYRRAMLEQLALDGEIFPEIYFAYYEDVDLSWRMNLAGWQCLYVPQAVGRHVRGGSTRGSTVTRRLVFRNRYVLLARNDRHSELLHHIGPVLRLEVFQLFRVFRHPSLILQLPDVLRSVIRAWRQRKSMKHNGRTAFGLSALNHLVSPGAGLKGWFKQART